MDILLEDGVLLNVLELGLEVLQSGSVRARIGSTTSVGKVEAFILYLFTFDTPVYSSQPCADGAGSARSVVTNQPPFPAPFFLVFFGSAST